MYDRTQYCVQYESSHLGRAWYVGELAECVSRSRHVRRGDVNSNTQVMHVPYAFGLILVTAAYCM